MKLIETIGATSRIWQIFIADSSSTTGAGLTGLVFNSGSLTAYYHRDTDTTATAITLVTMTVGTFTSSGFKEIDATNMPGWYQLCPPNAAIASGAKSCALLLKGATNMAPLPIEVQLVAYDTQDAVRLGLTALPNANAAASGGLPTIGVTIPNATAGASGGLQIAGSNAATTYASLTCTGSLTISDGLLVSRSTNNTSAATFTGTGTGHGAVFTSGTGATGDGVQMTAGSTNGSGLKLTKTGSGSDLNATVTPLVLAKTTNLTGLNDIAATAVVSSGAITTSGGAVSTVSTVTSTSAIGSGGITNASFAADVGFKSVRSNTAQAGASTTITLDASASAVDGFYNNDLVVTTGGTGAGQARFISGYVGSTKVATVAAWKTNPDNTTTFAILPYDAVAGASAPTAAQVATAVWTDLLASSDFSTSASIGKLLKDDIDAAVSSRMATYTQPTGFLAATFPTTVASPTNITAGTITTVTTVTNQLTAAQIATGVWQDATSGDFTVASSIGKSLYTTGNAPGAASGIALVGSNMGSASSVTGSVGSVTGAVGSVTGNVGGSVASVTGNVGGNVVGSVASVTARVTANTDQLAGQTVSAAAGVTFPSSVASPTNITAASGVALTSAYNPAKTAAQAGDAMALVAGAVDSTALDSTAGDEIADALLDRASAIETGLTPRGAIRLIAATAAGNVTGLDTGSVVIKNAVAASKTRITATGDSASRTINSTDVT